jgi:methylase of polypeptide subunit release factors
VAHLDFGGLTIDYDERVLEPRPWTAAQSRWAAELARDAPYGPVLELCSGAGHIGLLTARLTDRPLVCVDVSAAACELTRANAATAGLDVEVRQGAMDQVLAPDERFPVVVADPPWVPRAEVAAYPEDPVLAIDGGTTGLDLVRSCLEVIATHLAPSGSAVLQAGPGALGGAAASVVASVPALRLVEHRAYERGTLLRLERA